MSKIQLNCKYCGKSFLVRLSHSKRTKYCSLKCMSEDYKTRLIKENNPHWRGGQPKKICQYCGKEFISSNVKYCSVACANKAQKKRPDLFCMYCGKLIENRNIKYCSVECRKKDLQTLRGNCLSCGKPLPKGNELYCSKNCYKNAVWITARCPECHKIFIKRKSDIRKHCSTACANKAQTVRQYGKGSHFWQGGKTKGRRRLRNHPLYKEWRKKVFERDDYTCTNCGQKGGKLTAHHIVPVSVNLRKALRLSNGTTLCWKCHSELHKGVQNKHSVDEVSGKLNYERSLP